MRQEYHVELQKIGKLAGIPAEQREQFVSAVADILAAFVERRHAEAQDVSLLRRHSEPDC